jgi:hypothetical protein
MHTKFIRVGMVIALLGLFGTTAAAQDKLTRIRVAYPSGGICCLAL